MLWRREDFIAIGCLLGAAMSILCVTAQVLIFGPRPTPTEPATPSASPFTPPTPESACYTENCLSACLDDLAGVPAAEDEPEGSRAFEADKEYLLVEYDVDGQEIRQALDWPVPAEVEPYQSDAGDHERIWNLFTAFIPPEERAQVSGFLLFTDGPGEELGGVELSDSDSHKWILEIDPIDAQDPTQLVLTLMHEFAHLLTLNADQVPPAQDLYENPDDDAIYEQAVAACPVYFTGEGCSRSDSYINQFFNQFWPEIYSEWQDIDAIDDDEERRDRLHGFYERYADQFVTAYAATSPEEDIAESFTDFVLKPAPRGYSRAEDKLMFFYSFPELVTLRTRLQQRVCGALNP